MGNVRSWLVYRDVDKGREQDAEALPRLTKFIRLLTQQAATYINVFPLKN